MSGGLGGVGGRVASGELRKARQAHPTSGGCLVEEFGIPSECKKKAWEVQEVCVCV